MIDAFGFKYLLTLLFHKPVLLVSYGHGFVAAVFSFVYVIIRDVKLGLF